MKITYYALSDCGKVRSENQDSYVLPDSANGSGPVANFAVFDGMGGEQSGGKASAIAKDAFISVIKETPLCSLKKLTLFINGLICKYMEEFGIKRMGSTASILRVTSEKAQVCNVGDSRIYRISKGKITQLSVDHAMMVGQRRVLTQHLGIPVQEMILEPHESTCECSEGDVFVLCSDGLTDMLDEKAILETVVGNDFVNVGQVLLDTAMEKGGKDNITIVMCKIGES